MPDTSSNAPGGTSYTWRFAFDIGVTFTDVTTMIIERKGGADRPGADQGRPDRGMRELN